MSTEHLTTYEALKRHPANRVPLVDVTKILESEDIDKTIRLALLAMARYSSHGVATFQRGEQAKLLGVRTDKLYLIHARLVKWGLATVANSTEVALNPILRSGTKTDTFGEYLLINKGSEREIRRMVKSGLPVWFGLFLWWHAYRGERTVMTDVQRGHTMRKLTVDMFLGIFGIKTTNRAVIYRAVEQLGKVGIFSKDATPQELRTTTKQDADRAMYDALGWK